MPTKSFKFLTSTQTERKGDVAELDTDSDRCAQLLKRGMIEPYTPVEETKVVEPKQTKVAPKTTKAK